MAGEPYVPYVHVSHTDEMIGDSRNHEIVMLPDLMIYEARITALSLSEPSTAFYRIPDPVKLAVPIPTFYHISPWSWRGLRRTACYGMARHGIPVALLCLHLFMFLLSKVPG